MDVKLNRTTSIYLDLIRFISALLVFFFHAKYARFDGAWLKEVGAYGHDAVMVFFVLSGFVIAYVTSYKEKTVSSYTVRRLSRLYSVVVPALLLTLILDYFGKMIDPSMYVGGHYQASEPVIRFLANLFFLNELWFESYRAFSNGPFWSLSYEFWYYVIFACWFYFSGYKKLFLVSIALLIAGPKIVILFPVWVTGVVAYHISLKATISKNKALAMAILPFLFYFAMRDTGLQKLLLSETVDLLGRDFVYKDLKWSRRFISDYIVGILVAMHLIGVIALSKRFSFSQKQEKVIRYFASMTFALYLLHYPLLQFYGSVFKNGVVIVMLTFITVIALKPISESRKDDWLRFFERVFLRKKSGFLG